MNVAIRSEHLNILSICTGGAGLDHGIELAIPSARTVCMVEREAFAVSTLVSAMEEGLLHPAPVWSDATTFNGRAWRGAVDGLIGGIPCQPHSLAGRKQGSNDARDLWSTARRIIVQSGAWFVVIENVGGMLAAGSDEIAGAQRVFRDLSKLGFETEGGLFTAAEVGASHQRERIFILGVAYPVCERVCGRHGRRQNAADALASSEGNVRSVVDAKSLGRRERRTKSELWSRRDAASSTDSPMDDASIARGRRISIQPRGQDQASAHLDGTIATMGDTVSCGCSRGQDVEIEGSERRATFERTVGPAFLFPPGPDHLPRWASVLASSPELEPAFRRVADGLASRLDIGRVDRLRMLGNGVVPLQAAYAVRTLATRLASRGSAGATRLVRMMEGIEA